MAKLTLTPAQIETLLEKRDLYDNETKTKVAQRLVELGLYRDTGDARPFFTLTNRGEQARNALFELHDLGLTDWTG
jgi:hypothetical protein